MIKKLTISNFRSIKHAEIELGMLNAFVGANNAGKTAIMTALNIVLGERWPTYYNIEDDDFYNRDTSAQIEITVEFDAPLEGTNITKFEFISGRSGQFFRARSLDGVYIEYVRKEIRDAAAAIYVDIDRQADQQLKANKFSLYGKLLDYIGNQIDAPKRENFSADVVQSYNDHLGSHESLRRLQDILKRSIEEQLDIELNLKLSVVDPTMVIKNLRPYFKEMIDLDADRAGRGVQSLLALGIAQAYSEIVRRAAILIIEEPEIHLHPQACRNLYKKLQAASESGVQVIYSTHSCDFVDLSNFSNLRVVRKTDSETIVCASEITNQDHKMLKNLTKFDMNTSVVFFSNNVVLVEGQQDLIACQMALDKVGFDYKKKNIAIVEVGSKDNLNGIGKILKSFHIPVCFLIDEDWGSNATVIMRLGEEFGEDRVFVQNHTLEDIFRYQNPDATAAGRPSHFPDTYSAIAYIDEWFNTNEPPEVYMRLITKLESHGAAPGNTVVANQLDSQMPDNSRI